MPSVSAGARGVDVALRPGLVARLELVDARGEPLTRALVHLRGAHRNDRVWAGGDQPAFVIASLWAGRFRFDIEVAAKGRHHIDVEAGKTVRYVVR